MPSTKSASIKGVSHIMVGVSDFDRSLAFYRDALGLPVQQQFPGFAFLDAGGVTLALSTGLFQALGGGPGALEIVIGVTDIDAAYAELVERGVQFTQIPRQVTPTDFAANFQDPDGLHLSIFGPRTSADAHDNAENSK